MKLKDKIKSYSFWISLGSAVILILKIIGNEFGFSVDAGLASDLLTSLCSILVLFGIIVTPATKTENELKQSLETLVQNEPQANTTEELNENSPCESEPSSFEQEINNDTISQSNPIEELKADLTENNSLVFRGKEIPNDPNELNAFFENEKQKFKEDIDIYIESLKNEFLSKINKTE